MTSYVCCWSDECDHVSLVDCSIVIDVMINMTRCNEAGAVSTFLGTTRDTFEEKVVTHLSYEAYNDMAIECMKEICKKIRQQWNVVKIVIQHKLGDCPVGDVSVLIAISSAHRIESLQAIQFAIDELKRTVPIWKKEYYNDNGDGDACQWKKNNEFDIKTNNN